MVSSSWFGIRLRYGLILACCAALLGCGPTAHSLCFTDQGLGITNTSPELCAKYNIQAEFMVANVGNRERLRGYVVTRRDIYSWEDPYKRPLKEDPTKIMWVGGLTWCPSKRIEVGTGDTAFPHEILHALENCSDPEHSQWKEKGYEKLIEEAAKL